MSVGCGFSMTGLDEGPWFTQVGSMGTLGRLYLLHGGKHSNVFCVDKRVG